MGDINKESRSPFQNRTLWGPHASPSQREKLDYTQLKQQQWSLTPLRSYCESGEAGRSGTTPQISEFKELVKETFNRLHIIRPFLKSKEYPLSVSKQTQRTAQRQEGQANIRLCLHCVK